MPEAAGACSRQCCQWCRRRGGEIGGGEGDAAGRTAARKLVEIEADGPCVLRRSMTGEVRRAGGAVVVGAGGFVAEVEALAGGVTGVGRCGGWSGATDPDAPLVVKPCVAPGVKLADEDRFGGGGEPGGRGRLRRRCSAGDEVGEDVVAVGVGGGEGFAGVEDAVAVDVEEDLASRRRRYRRGRGRRCRWSR